MLLFRQFLYRSLQKPNLFLCSVKSASTYEGDGKTTAMVLQKELDYLMIDTVSTVGFGLNSGIRVLGPMILLPRTFFSWNIADVNEVGDPSFSLFTMLCPKIDILVFGYGDAKGLPQDVKRRVEQYGKANNIGLEILPTVNAISTFNYLNHERRFVGGAFIPPQKLEIYTDEEYFQKKHRQRLLTESDE